MQSTSKPTNILKALGIPYLMNLVKILYLNGKPDMTCHRLMKHLKHAAYIFQII